MTDDRDDSFFTPTDGGVAARHPRRQVQPVLVAPSTEGEINTIQEEILPVACVRMEDIRFEFNSSFIAQGAARELNLLARLRSDVPGMPVSVFGHADPVGDDDYNKKLSGRRAAAVYALLTRNTDIWEDIYLQRGEFTDTLRGDNWGIESIQVMLTNLGHYAGPTHGRLDADTRAAVEAFQRSPEGEGLEPDGDPGRNTRPKLYRAYMDRICVDDAGQPFQLDPAADFVAHGADPHGKGDYQGCSEFNPVLVFSRSEDQAFRRDPDKTERNRENLPNRRVLLFLFRPGFSISPDNWPCPRAKDGFAACRRRFHVSPPNGDARRRPQDERREYRDTANTDRSTFACRFYDRLAIESPCELGGPPVQSHLLSVHLRLRWTDPLAAEHDFPPDFPVTVLFPSGLSIDTTVGANGYVNFIVDRGNRSFTLTFDFTDTTYIGSAPPSAPAGLAPERLLTDTDVEAALAQGYRVFMAPSVLWSLRNSDWTATGAATYSNGDFLQLETLGNTLGTVAVPVVMVLDPHWQYMKFLYFDRRLRRKLSIPPIMVEGFGLRELAVGDPDTSSNWSTPQGCQCLPWILQRGLDGSPAPKPDADVLVQFRTAARLFPGRTVGGSALAGTFIDSPRNRRLVTSHTASTGTSPDPGLNKGTSVNTDFDQPNAARLGFYDLPPLWKSHGYFARFFTSAGAATNRSGRFADLAAEATSDARPLLFSLDDVVLVDDRLRPVSWNPANDRVAIFSHQLHRGVSTGLHRPDSNLRYLSQPPTLVTNRNYLADYPDWTRLIIMRGNLYDVFDRRTPESDTAVVGARAAVRWFDGTSRGAPGSTISPRPAAAPAAADATFTVVQGFFRQVHPNRGTVGRCDQAILRCCDMDGNTEIAVNLHYLRYNFDFSPAAIPSRNTEANTLSAGQRQPFVNTAAARLAQRWNGPDGDFNPGDARLITGSTGPRLRVQIIWFIQVFPHPLTATFQAREAQYTIDIFKKVRAFMNATRGRGAIEQTENVPEGGGRYTLAHESGHADSLEDEYIETDNNASYYEIGFEDFIPGSPFYSDRRAMMRGNRLVRPRHFWHAAEWLRSLYSVPFQVQHDGFTFSLPPHPQAPRVTYVTDPFREARNAHSGTENFGFYDCYLFRLGAEPFSQEVLSHGPFTGFISVVVRMKLTFPHNNHNRLRDQVTEIRQGIQEKLNGKFFVTGTVGGLQFRCRFTFSPRVLVTNDSGDSDYHKDVGVSSSRTYAQVVQDVENAFGTHFDVTIVDHRTAPTILTTSSGSAGRLQFNMRRHDLEDDFPRYFGGMIGLSLRSGTLDQPNNFEPVARQVIPNARVQRLPT